MASDHKPDPYDLGQSSEPKRVEPKRRSEPRFDALERRGLHVITLLDRDVLDAHEIEELGSELNAYCKKKHGAKVILDMQCVRHLSSAALGMLLVLKSTTEGNGGALRLANVTPEIQKIFKMTKLHKVLIVKESVEAAAASL